MGIQEKIGKFLLAGTGLGLGVLYYHETNIDPQTKALHDAIGNRDIKTIKSLFHLREKGVLSGFRNLNPERKHNELTPLQRAISIGDMEILALLLKSGVNPNGRNNQYTSVHPLNICAVTHAIFSKHDEEKKIEMIKLLQNYGGEINDYSASGKNIPIFAAIESGYIKIATYLIGAGVNTTVTTRGPRVPGRGRWKDYQPCDAAMGYLVKPDDEGLVKLFLHDKSANDLLLHYKERGKRYDIYCDLIEYEARKEEVPGKAVHLSSYVKESGQCEPLYNTCSAGHSK
jgi:hypothetical protein